jgi:hypothetical protein
METLTKNINDTIITTSCIIDWSIKETIGEVNGNETIEQFLASLQLAFNKFKMSLTHEKGFFTLLYADVKSPNSLKLLYIGMVTQAEHIRPAKPEDLEKVFQCITQKLKNKILYVKLGGIKAFTPDNKSGQLFEEVEKYLVYSNKPMGNVLKDFHSNSKNILMIENSGNYNPLRYKCDLT